GDGDALEMHHARRGRSRRGDAAAGRRLRGNRGSVRGRRMVENWPIACATSRRSATISVIMRRQPIARAKHGYFQENRRSNYAARKGTFATSRAACKDRKPMRENSETAAQSTTAAQCGACVKRSIVMGHRE